MIFKSLNIITKPMKTRYLLLFVLPLMVLFSCKDDVEIIRGRVTIYNPSLPNQPVVGLPVSIYVQSKPNIEQSISEQILFSVSNTDNDGYYQFSTTEFDIDELMRYNAYFVKSVPFDSTLTEWMYLQDSTYYKLIDEWNGTTADPTRYYYSHVKGHYYDFQSNNLMVLPAGWLVFVFENQVSPIIVSTGNYHTLYNNIPQTFRMPHFMLVPSKEYNFKISRYVNNQEVELKSVNIFVRNSFTRNSCPGNEGLIPDTVRVNLSTLEVTVIRAEL